MTDTYQILTADNAYELEMAVNLQIRNGWDLHGNLVMSMAIQPPTPHGSLYPQIEVLFAQAMVLLPTSALFAKAQVAESSLAHSEN